LKGKLEAVAELKGKVDALLTLLQGAKAEMIGLPGKRASMRSEMFLPFLFSYALAARQCRADLMATQSRLQNEVAKLRKELAAARAELYEAVPSTEPSAKKIREATSEL